MKITLPKEEDGFVIKPNLLHGEKVLLITTHHMGVKWTVENSIFRSSVWSEDLKPISLGFRKFVNYGEQPTYEPLDENKPLTYIEKKDGSCLLVSKYKGNLVVRTRGTVDATNLDNGHEIPFLIKKYPKAFDNDILNTEIDTLVFEWETPSNFIVIKDVVEPTLTFTGMISHYDYTYYKQSALDHFAKQWGVPRPKTFFYPNLLTAVQDVKGWIGVEGMIVVDETGQIFKKVKAEDYLKKHAFKSDMSIKNLRELYFQLNEPSKEVFLNHIRDTIDFECMNMSVPLVDAITDGAIKMAEQVAEAKQFIQPLIGLPRKEAAERILTHYNKSLMSGFCFKFLDGKDLDVMAKKKLLEFIVPNDCLDIRFDAGKMDI